MCYSADEHMKHSVAGCTTHVHLNALIDTIRWLVTSTGTYVTLWGYRLLRSTVNIYLKK